MKLSLHRVLLTAVAVTVVAFLTAGFVGDHDSGARGVIGDAAWITFLCGLLATIALAGAVLVQSALRRRRAGNRLNAH